MTTTETENIIGTLSTTLQDHIDKIDRDLASTYISRWPFCVVLEDNSMGIAYEELQGVLGIEEVYRLSPRPADCLRFSKAMAERVADLWNEDPKRPRVKVMEHVKFYEELRKIKQRLLKSLPKDCNAE